ncbi:PASTA domain-containing protein [Terracoccus sp. 273MFTsu3.1]|uniref:PASTA domain-containing protein n=1 Tax=Terracoccus sp. 273MFTsu3.1 TaxID=1172188 RepID=UPI0012DF2C49|nr:PASTA domain-containing protein [Terracoccus sp. 273MFTsu3.1]
MRKRSLDVNSQDLPTPNAPTKPTIQLPPPLGQPPQSWPPSAPQPLPQKRSKKHLIGYPVTALLALGIGAAGGGNADATPPATASSTVVVTQTVPVPSIATATQTLRATVTVAASRAPVAVAAPKPASKVTVPDGVGMNYQDAQDAWRAAGLHVAPAEDATGAHRIPVLDANWVVLAQNLQAGSKVAVDSFIIATIKKYSDN